MQQIVRRAVAARATAVAVAAAAAACQMRQKSCHISTTRLPLAGARIVAAAPLSFLHEVCKFYRARRKYSLTCREPATSSSSGRLAAEHGTKLPSGGKITKT